MDFPADPMAQLYAPILIPMSRETRCVKDDIIHLEKLSRVGGNRRPALIHKGMGVDGKAKFSAKLNWKNYAAAMPPHDPCDAELYEAAFARYLEDTKYFRFDRKKNALVHRGGAMCHKAAWLKENTGFNAPECRFFPAMVDGRVERVKYNFKEQAAARAMLLMTQGLPKDKSALATHICGNGHLSCVNPAHLKWGSASDNARDAVVHNAPSEFIAGMAEETIREIYNAKKLVKVLAYEYNIPAKVVSGIKSGDLWSSVAA
jgi:hypothetical protein